jgi:hypothetical protein
VRSRSQEGGFSTQRSATNSARIGCAFMGARRNLGSCRVPDWQTRHSPDDLEASCLVETDATRVPVGTPGR